MSPARVAVVGASAAGLGAAEALRRGGFDGAVTLVGAEPHLPYDRPPLSKQLLSGAWEADRLRLRSDEAIDDLDLDLRLGTTASALDPGARKLSLHSGEIVGYDELVIATGVRPRRLPGTEDVAGVHVLRTLDDALALREALAGHPRLVVVGGGFMGAEAASAARELGAEVTLVTDTAMPLADVLGEELGGVLTATHRDHGVRIEAGVLVGEVLAERGRVTGVRLSDERTLPADLVLVAIGAIPNVEWLAGSGVPVGNGVECDETCSAGPGVWAAGDVASWPHPDLGRRIRIEHRTNATEQGMAVARNLLADDGGSAFAPVPYIWSDQYDRKIQIYGRPQGADRVCVVEGSLTERRLVALYGRQGRVCAVVGINMARAARGFRPLVAERRPWPAATELVNATEGERA
ncbi:NAD(P)/FAD-dependent oxidoreductase [Saccharopolyspora gloriosae]|uniref:NAD(P)/FAD-dependent oxidoreductase n=1 Tax=Saccharopolyspora gloriosae TaxID=455344 RepID=UPI001FB72275|nr:FAD/NAD(P)-binding oxidoreductase [Saccharopolyspora gloriosae]